MEPKRFDCVEMKRRGAEKIQRLLQSMTEEQELAFWNEGTEALLREQRNATVDKGTDRKKKKTLS
jgi:hypothetical protein